MVGAIGLLAAGFLGGVVLTGIAACYLFGLLHAEAVRALAGEGVLFLGSSGRPPAVCPKAPRPSPARAPFDPPSS